MADRASGPQRHTGLTHLSSSGKIPVKKRCATVAQSVGRVTGKRNGVSPDETGRNTRISREATRRNRWSKAGSLTGLGTGPDYQHRLAQRPRYRPAQPDLGHWQRLQDIPAPARHRGSVWRQPQRAVLAGGWTVCHRSRPDADRCDDRASGFRSVGRPVDCIRFETDTRPLVLNRVGGSGAFFQRAAGQAQPAPTVTESCR